MKQSLPHNYTCRNRTTCMLRNRKPCNSFFMVSMASGMDHRCVCPTTILHNMLVILKLICRPRHAMQPWFPAYIFDIGHPCYGQLTAVKTRYLLTSTMRPYRRHKFGAHLGHNFFLKLTADQAMVFNLNTSSCQVILLIRARLVGRYTNVFHCFCVV